MYGEQRNSGTWKGMLGQGFFFFFNVRETIFLFICCLLMELSDGEEGKLMIQQRGENHWTDSPFSL